MAIQKTVVNHNLIDPSAKPIQRAGVITLGGFKGREWVDIQGMSVDGQIITSVDVNTNASGSWSVQLIPNADIADPENTLYRFKPVSGAPVVFLVPVSSTPVVLKNLVVADPAQWPSLSPTIRGPKGDQGDKGDKGDQGIQGVQGVKGDKGDQGIQGVPGPKGDKGDPGNVSSVNSVGPNAAGNVTLTPSNIGKIVEYIGNNKPVLHELTQAQFDAINPKDPHTWYMVTDA